MTLRLPFGKHKGKDIRNVPTDYLNWLLYAAKDGVVNVYLADALKQELSDRETRGKVQKGKPKLKQTFQSRPPKPKRENDISAADFLQLPENLDDYAVCMMGNVQEMAQASERIRQRWEARV